MLTGKEAVALLPPRQRAWARRRALFVVLKPARSLRGREPLDSAGCSRAAGNASGAFCGSSQEPVLRHSHAHQVPRTQKEGGYRPRCLRGAGGLAMGMHACMHERLPCACTQKALAHTRPCLCSPSDHLTARHQTDLLTDPASLPSHQL